MRNISTYQTTSYTPDNLPAIYERDVANIYLQYFTRGEDTLINEADLERIIDIAGKCSVVSGNSVYDAQALLRLLNPEIEFDWLSNCENAGLRIDDENEEYLLQSKKMNNIIIAPNPAKDIINLSGIYESCQLTLYSINGELLKYLAVSGTNNQIDVSDLVNGVYILKLNGLLTYTVQRLVIIK